jgi:hypothetical protein
MHTQVFEDKLYVYATVDDMNTNLPAFILQLCDYERCMIVKDSTASFYKDRVHNRKKILKIIEILLEK